MASWDSLHKASIRWCKATSSKYRLDSNNRLNIVDNTGKSAAITAVVMTAIFDEDEVVVTAADDEPTTEPSTEAEPPVCLFPVDVTPPFPALRLPPVDGFNPSIQTRCYKNNACLQTFLIKIHK